MKNSSMRGKASNKMAVKERDANKCLKILGYFTIFH